MDTHTQDNDAPSTTDRLKKAALFTLKLSATVGLIWFAVRDVDFAKAWSLTKQLHPLAIVGAFAALAVKTLAGTWRWQIVLRALDTSARYVRLLALFMLGLFFNTTLPSSIGGDAVRIWRLKEADHIDLGVSTRSVLLERIAGFVVLLVMVGAGTPLLWQWTQDGDAALTYGLVAGLGLLSVAAILPFGGMEREGRHKAIRAVLKLARDVRILFTSPKKAGVVLGLSLLYQIAHVMVVYALAKGIGVELSVLEAMVLVPVVLLAITLPISIGGWGVREAGLVTTLGLVGVGSEAAVVVSVLFGVILILWGLVCGAASLALGVEPRRPTRTQLSQAG